eukprot:2137226-Lingulodinium_polyedra.AAC.1
MPARARNPASPLDLAVHASSKQLEGNDIGPRRNYKRPFRRNVGQPTLDPCRAPEPAAQHGPPPPPLNNA